MIAPVKCLDRALAAVRAGSHDPLDLLKAEELLNGYHCRWGDEEITVLAVEVEFVAPLVNPETNAASRTFVDGGKLDVMARIGPDDAVLEHKSSGEDISPGAAYWQGLRMNPQIGTYLRGARALGHDPRLVLYDVIGKVKLEPYEATPAESRTYTKPTKKDPVPRLYATQRERDETLDEYRLRVREHIVANPDRYYQRGTVVRTDEDELDSAADDWQTARTIRELEKVGRYPRNPDACRKFGTTCEYLGVCTRVESIDDDLLFRSTASKHDELDGKHKLPILSNSERGTFRACPRKHHYSYRLGRRSHRKSAALTFGTLIHVGLEAWWRALQSHQLGQETSLRGMPEVGAPEALVEVFKREPLVASQEKKEVPLTPAPTGPHTLPTDPPTLTTPAPTFVLDF